MTGNIYIATKYTTENKEKDIVLTEEKYDITEYFYELVQDNWELNLQDTGGFFDVLFSKIKDFSPEKDHPTYWGAALCGESGEVANLLKKLERDGLMKTVNKLTNMKDVREVTKWDKQIFGEKLGEELADVMIYCILIARKFPDVDLKQSLRDKLMEVDRRIREGEVIERAEITWICDNIDCDESTLELGTLCTKCEEKYEVVAEGFGDE